jgi:hypothetical protein
MGTPKRWNKLCWILVCLLVGMPLWAVDPVVSNVRSVQRPGTRLIDITYYVAGSDSPTVGVALEVSAANGVTHTVPAETFSGDVGNGIKPGLSADTSVQLEVRAPEGFRIGFETSCAFILWTQIQQINGSGIRQPIKNCISILKSA